MAGPRACAPSRTPGYFQPSIQYSQLIPAPRGPTLEETPPQNIHNQGLPQNPEVTTLSHVDLGSKASSQTCLLRVLLTSLYLPAFLPPLLIHGLLKIEMAPAEPNGSCSHESWGGIFMEVLS